MAEISYYDNVKDDVKDQNTGEKANFDALRKAAEESSEDDKEGDDTEIEVLEDGLKRAREKVEDSQQPSLGEGQESRQSTESGAAGAGPAALEQKLDRIIEQNERMIDILESFRG